MAPPTGTLEVYLKKGGKNLSLTEASVLQYICGELYFMNLQSRKG